MRNFKCNQNQILFLTYVIFGLFLSIFFDLLLSTHIYTLSVLGVFLGFITLTLIFKIIFLIQNKKHI